MHYAALAPTGIKLRPWEIRLVDTHFELMMKEDPVLEAIDPDRRESTIGCGAALLYLKLALKHFGWFGRVAVFPDFNHPRRVACIYPGTCCERDAPSRLLFEAMQGSRVRAWSGDETAVTAPLLAALAGAAAGERGWLDFVQSEVSRRRVIEITLASEQNAVTADIAHDRQTELRPRSFFPFGGRRNGAGKLRLGPMREVSVPPTTLAVVKTKTDDKHGWLAAGQTMARAILQAQALDLSWAFVNQVRRPGAREALRLGVGHKGFAQVILRFGSIAGTETMHVSKPLTVSVSASC